MLFENLNLGITSVALAQDDLVEIDSSQDSVVFESEAPVLTEYEVETNSEGNWELELDNNFTSGLHTVTAIDEEGNEVATALFAMEPDVNVYESAESVSLNWIYLLLFFLLVFLGLSVYNLVRVMRMAKKSRSKVVKKFAHFEEAFSGLLIVVLLVTLGYVGYKGDVYANLFENHQAEVVAETELEESLMVVASGAIVNPLSLEPVEGIDLSLGNQSIHTASSGRFNFNAVTGDLAIKVNYPELKRAVKYFVTPEFDQDIYFDLGLINRLSEVLNLEAQENSEGLYNLAYAPLREKVSYKKFMKKYDFIYRENNLADQFLMIKSVELVKNWESELSDEKYKKVYKVTTFANGEFRVLSFVFNEGWFLVE